MMRTSELLLVTLLPCLVISSLYHTPEDCPLHHINYDPKYGLINEEEVYEEFECMDLCDDLDDCVAYNIELPELTCELNDAAADSTGIDMIPRKGWTYWEKGDSKDESSQTCSIDWLVNGRKQREVVDIPNPTLVYNLAGYFAWWGKETKYIDSRVYMIYSATAAANALYEFSTEELFAAGLGGQELFHLCPHLSEGFQNIVYDQKFWYRENDQRRVLAMNLDTDLIVGMISLESLEGSTYGPYIEQCTYNSGLGSGLDIEVDGSGMWFIYGRITHSCGLTISKIDTNNYRIIRSWSFDGLQKTAGGTGFMIDNIFYLTDRFDKNPTYIRLEVNLHNNSVISLPPYPSYQHNVPVVQPGLRNVQTHWNEAEQKLYVTDTKHAFYWVVPNFRELP